MTNLSVSKWVANFSALKLREWHSFLPVVHSAAAEADAIDPLINILSSKRDGAIANAATVLTNMATQEPLRAIIQNHEIMHALLGPLHSTNTLVQSTAALTVAATACDVEARTQVRLLRGSESCHLLRLLPNLH
jgi:hypothetical protein